MKWGILWMFLLASVPIYASCSQDLHLEGEVVSFQKIQGKPQPHRFYSPIGDSLDQHAGVFRNIRLKSNQSFQWVEVFHRKYPLVKDGQYLVTKNLMLTKRIYEEKAAQVELTFGPQDIECKKVFRGAIGD